MGWAGGSAVIRRNNCARREPRQPNRAAPHLATGKTGARPIESAVGRPLGAGCMNGRNSAVSRPTVEMGRTPELRELSPRPLCSPPNDLTSRKNENSQSEPSIKTGGKDSRPEREGRRDHREIVGPRIPTVRAPATPCVEDACRSHQASAMIQIALRGGTGTNRPANMATCGIHHANRFVRGLRSQSLEGRAVSLVMLKSRRAAGRRPALTRMLGLDQRTRYRSV
jgi:hypothetical protein